MRVARPPSHREPWAVIVVAIDGNGSTPAAKRQAIREATLESFGNRVIAACPDPHIERW